jgi:hypothetical protein
MSHLNLIKYSLHFSIFALIILALGLNAGKVYASGDIVNGSIKASYALYDDNSLSYTLNFEIQNNDSSRYLSSFTFSVPFKEYSALNVTASNLGDYDVIPHEYNSIQLNFARPMQYLDRSTVTVNITVATIGTNVSGNPEIELVNPVTGQSVNYTVNAPTALGNLSLSKNIQKSSTADKGKNITTFTTTEGLRMTWRTEELYSFRMRYSVKPDEGGDALINLPFETTTQLVYYSTLSGIYAAIFDDVGNVFGAAKEGEVNIEFQIDATRNGIISEETQNLKETEYLKPDTSSTFYEEFKSKLESTPTLSQIVTYLNEKISLNRGFKASYDMIGELWHYSVSDRELNSFEASLLIHGVLRDLGQKAELRYGFVVDPFEVNFPIAWVESEYGTIDLFSLKYMNSDDVKKVTFGVWNNNKEDLMLGVFGDTPEVVRIEPVSNLEIDRTTTGISLSSDGVQVTADNSSARVLKISSILKNSKEVRKSINGYYQALLPGSNVLGVSNTGNITVKTADGQESSLQTNVEDPDLVSSEVTQTNIKTGILIAGVIVIIILVFFVKRSPKQLKFEERS